MGGLARPGGRGARPHAAAQRRRPAGARRGEGAALALAARAHARRRVPVRLEGLDGDHAHVVRGLQALHALEDGAPLLAAHGHRGVAALQAVPLDLDAVAGVDHCARRRAEVGMGGVGGRRQRRVAARARGPHCRIAPPARARARVRRPGRASCRRPAPHACPVASHPSGPWRYQSPGWHGLQQAHRRSRLRETAGRCAHGWRSGRVGGRAASGDGAAGRVAASGRRLPGRCRRRTGVLRPQARGRGGAGHAGHGSEVPRPHQRSGWRWGTASCRRRRCPPSQRRPARGVGRTAAQREREGRRGGQAAVWLRVRQQVGRARPAGGGTASGSVRQPAVAQPIQRQAAASRGIASRLPCCTSSEPRRPAERGEGARREAGSVSGRQARTAGTRCGNPLPPDWRRCSGPGLHVLPVVSTNLLLLQAGQGRRAAAGGSGWRSQAPGRSAAGVVVGSRRACAGCIEHGRARQQLGPCRRWLPLFRGGAWPPYRPRA